MEYKEVELSSGRRLKIRPLHAGDLIQFWQENKMDMLMGAPLSFQSRYILQHCIENPPPLEEISLMETLDITNKVLELSGLRASFREPSEPRQREQKPEAPPGTG